MKMPFLKFRGKDEPNPASLRRSLFNSDSAWFAALGLFLLISIITSAIGFKLFYNEYFEGGESEESPENFEDLINVSRLKSSIEKRGEFLNRQTPLPRDPSI